MKRRTVRMHRIGVLNPDGHTIGVDIGARGVRAAVLAPRQVDGRPTVTIHGAGQVPLSAGAVVNGEIREPATVTAALRQLWSENRLDCRNVVVGIANQQALVRSLTIPNVDAATRAKALPFQAKDVVALPIEEVILDFCQLAPPDGANQVEGLLIATPREPIRTAVAAVEAANLKVARVDLASFGMLRAIGAEQLAVEAILDLGAHLSTIVIHDHGVPKLVRTLTRGGDELTDALAERLDTSREDAEKAKIATGLSDPSTEVSRGLADALRPLLAEIRTSIGYYRASAGSTPIERIALTGGGAALTGIVEAVEQQIGLPAYAVDPLQHVRNRHTAREGHWADAQYQPSAVSVGLAMGAAA